MNLSHRGYLATTALSLGLLICQVTHPQGMQITLSLKSNPQKSFTITTGAPIDLASIHGVSADDAFEAIISYCDVVVDCYATWCGPCKMMATTCNMVAPEFPEIVILKIDTEKFSSIARRFGVRGLPTLIYFKDGKKVKQEPGSLTKPQFIAKLQELYA